MCPHFPKPELIDIDLSIGHVTIPIYDWKNNIASLLLNSTTFHPNNIISCSFNDWDNNDYIDEVHSAQWYIDTHQYLNIHKDSNDLLIDVILYCDRASLSPFSDLGLEPLIMSLTIFNKQCRNLTQFWRIVSYLPKIESTKDSVSKPN